MLLRCSVSAECRTKRCYECLSYYGTHVQGKNMQSSTIFLLIWMAEHVTWTGQVKMPLTTQLGIIHLSPTLHTISQIIYFLGNVFLYDKTPIITDHIVFGRTFCVIWLFIFRLLGSSWVNFKSNLTFTATKSLSFTTFISGDIPTHQKRRERKWQKLHTGK